MSSVSLPPSVSVSLSLSVTLSFRCLCLLRHPVLCHVRLSSPFPVSSHYASLTPSYSLCDWEGTPDITAQLCVGVSNWLLWGGAGTTITISSSHPPPTQGPCEPTCPPGPYWGGQAGVSTEASLPGLPCAQGFSIASPSGGSMCLMQPELGGCLRLIPPDTQGLSTGRQFSGVIEVPVL